MTVCGAMEVRVLPTLYSNCVCVCVCVHVHLVFHACAEYLLLPQHGLTYRSQCSCLSVKVKEMHNFPLRKGVKSNTL